MSKNQNIFIKICENFFAKFQNFMILVQKSGNYDRYNILTFQICNVTIPSLPPKKTLKTSQSFGFTQIFLIFIIGIIMEQMFTFIKSMCLWKNCKKVDAGTLKIVKTANGFSFTNPGTLKLPKEEIYRGGNSKPRNPRMQTMLRMVGFGDNAGSGFPTILDVWEKAGWRQPELLEDTVLDQVTLELNIVSKMKEDENFVQKNERSFERSFRRKRL